MEYAVHTVSGGQDAVDAVERNEFVCILLDLNLPDMSGAELIEPLVAHAPVIVMTGQGDEAAAVDAMLAVAAAYKRRALGELEARFYLSLLK